MTGAIYVAGALDYETRRRVSRTGKLSLDLIFLLLFCLTIFTAWQLMLLLRLLLLLLLLSLCCEHSRTNLWDNRNSSVNCEICLCRITNSSRTGASLISKREPQLGAVLLLLNKFQRGNLIARLKVCNVFQLKATRHNCYTQETN